MRKKSVTLDDISIRYTLKPGDIGYVTYMHGALYSREYGFGVSFEAYVALGLHEFYTKYSPDRSRVWVCEHENKIVGFLVLMNRGDAAQLRYFIIDPAYRGIGLGKKLMTEFMDFLKQCGYMKCYLLTTHELHAAASLYTRWGFELTDDQPSSSFDKPLREQRYDLNIEMTRGWRGETLNDHI